MARIFDLTEALKDLIPVADGWPLHMQVEPLAGELPPWVIVTIANDGIIRNEIGGAIAGDGRIELRCVSDNTDSVNIWCDDHAIPALQGVIPKCDGFACSCLTIAGDGRIELRCVSDNTDSVNIWCDDHAIPALQGVIPKCDGFACSCLTLAEDSGTYAAGLTETDTAYRYRVRVLRFDFTWSRHDSP